jgi:predicted 3-demethylubiquinone-9 3-methyltransferase (glyoxalase superfamily)
MSKIMPCLWFDSRAEEAANFYVSTFRECGQEAAIGKVVRYTSTGPMPKGTVMTATFTLAGQEFLALNGGPTFTLSPAVSMMVKCRDQAEIDRFWARLSEGGQTSQCGWLTDRFGLSWQVIPATLEDLVSETDAARTERVMRAIMQMTKLDLSVLEHAARGDLAA